MEINKRGFEMLYQQIAFIIFIIIILISSFAFINHSRQAFVVNTQCKELALLLSYAEPSVIKVTGVEGKIQVDNSNLIIKDQGVNIKCQYYSTYDINVENNKIIITKSEE